MPKGRVNYDNDSKIFENKQEQKFASKRTKDVKFELNYTKKNIANDQIKVAKPDKGIDI